MSDTHFITTITILSQTIDQLKSDLEKQIKISRELASSNSYYENKNYRNEDRIAELNLVVRNQLNEIQELKNKYSPIVLTGTETPERQAELAQEIREQTRNTLSDFSGSMAIMDKCKAERAEAAKIDAKIQDDLNQFLNNCLPDLIKQNKKINAIKMVREITQGSLKDAKDCVERFIEQSDELRNWLLEHKKQA